MTWQENTQSLVRLRAFYCLNHESVMMNIYGGCMNKQIDKPFTTTRITVLSNTYHDTYHASKETAMRLFGEEVPLSAVEVNGIKGVEILYTLPGEGQPFTNFYKYRSMLVDGERIDVEMITEYPRFHSRITRMHFGHL